MTRPPPTALVLAAGSARRFGSDKRLARLPNGRLLLEEVCLRIGEAGLTPLLALDADAPQAVRGLARHLLIPSAIARQGMGATLAAAIAEIPAERGCLVCLGDMPWIEPATYRQVAAALTDETIVQPVYAGTPGHPVGFGVRYIRALATLSGDIGARSLLRAAGAQVIQLSVADAGIVHDVDDSADLRNLP